MSISLTTLGSRADGENKRKNNYDILRFFAAFLVILSHSFVLAVGEKSWAQIEPLEVLTHGKTFLGGIGLFTFFVLSGYLITASFERNPDWKAFLKNRCLRILPAFILVILTAVFVLGPLVTTLPLQAYFHDSATYQYLSNLTMLKWVDTLPGVFDGTPVPHFINGSLWTIRFEFYCYLSVLILGTLKLLKRQNVLALFTVVMCAHLFIQSPMSDAIDMSSGVLYVLKRFVELYMYFLEGTLFYLYRDRIPLHWAGILISAFILSVPFYTYELMPDPILNIAGAYLLFSFVYSKTLRFHNFAKHGDFSYGLYIYAWPIQQLTCQWLGSNVTTMSVFGVSFAITLALSILSWHWVEKYALALKDVVLFRSPKAKLLNEAKPIPGKRSFAFRFFNF